MSRAVIVVEGGVRIDAILEELVECGVSNYWVRSCSAIEWCRRQHWLRVHDSVNAGDRPCANVYLKPDCEADVILALMLVEGEE